MGIILWIVFGGIAGWIASLLAGEEGSLGLFGSIIVGIVGAFVGGFIMNTIGSQGVTGFNVSSLLVAVLGAVILLFGVRLFSQR